ncbi:MAG: HD-GYP domain-containing protein, partial [Endomicrobiales bacterium]
ATKEKASSDVHEVLRDAEDRMYRNKLMDGKSGRNAIISAVLKTLREKSHETSQHTQRLRKLVMEMGSAAGLPSNQIDELALLSVLHDIGKVSIPDEILMKPARLSPREWQTMIKHSEVGYRIAQSVSALAHVAEAILAHHERWDGSGYPRGLKKTQIPLISRILSVVDAYDVMIHGRPYERPVSQKHALDELQRNSGSQFDPEVVRVFVERIGQMKATPPDALYPAHSTLLS